MTDAVAHRRPAHVALYRRAPRPRVPRGYESVDSILLTEPRIEAARRELQALLAVVQLESDGEPFEPDGFRLRDVAHWADYPTSLSDIFWHLSSVCNFSCEFCYEKGNPPDFPIQSAPRMASDQEIDTRLRHYDVSAGLGVFSVRTAINEPFANPRAIEFLREMRSAAPGELISFVTNGSYLTEDKVAALAEVKPVFFNLSLYSTDPQTRLRTLRDRMGSTAVDACRLLASYEVPYMANVVMWPSITSDDMARTIQHAQTNGAAAIRICLGGYSKYLPGTFERFDATEFWSAVVDDVERVRDRFDIPILIEPNSFVNQHTDAVIDGVLVGSPAAAAGVKRGDVVVAVDGKTVCTRTQLQSRLRNGTAAAFRPPGVVGGRVGKVDGSAAQVVLDIERAGRRRGVTLDRYDRECMAGYPYREIASFNDFAYGLMITDSVRYSSLVEARKIIDDRGADHVLLLSSELIRPIASAMIEHTNVFAGKRVSLVVPRNDYFGGSINIGDLLTVEDFVSAVAEYSAANARPDLVLLPASPFATSPWGRDLRGRPWTDIERLTSIPTALIPCAPLIY